jgi:hypothetical protein
VNVGAGEPDHEPGDADRTWPCTVDPDTVGGLVFAGADDAAPTTALAADATGPACPALLVPVTNTTNVEPTSFATSVYVVAVCPASDTQLAPPLSQRCH